MINLKEFKKSLGPLVDEMTESEILELRELQDKEAEIFYSMWSKEVEVKKKST